MAGGRMKRNKTAWLVWNCQDLNGWNKTTIWALHFRNSQAQVQVASLHSHSRQHNMHNSTCFLLVRQFLKTESFSLDMST